MKRKLIVVTNPTGESWLYKAFQRAKCTVGQHQEQLHQQFGAYSRRIICPYCRGDWVHLSHPEGEMVSEWGQDFELLYRSFGFRIQPRPWELKAVKQASEEAEVEAEAKRIYATWAGANEYPWVEGGNSDKQYVARKQARAAIAARKEGGL